MRHRNHLKRSDKKKPPKKITKTDFEFDNCPICQLIKIFEKEGKRPTTREIEEAMMEKS